MDLKCTCGNKYLVALVVMSDDADVICQPSEEPTCYCPGCGAVWQFQGQRDAQGAELPEKWQKVVGVSSLQSLRYLSAK